MARHKQGRHAAPVAPSIPAARREGGGQHGRRSARAERGPAAPAARSGLVTGGRAAVLAAVVAGTGAITIAQASGGPGPTLAGAEAQSPSAAEAAALRESGTASRSQLAGRLALETAPERTVSVTVDGETREITTAAPQVADALAEAGIILGADDHVSVGLGEALAPGMDIQIRRVSTERVTERTVEEHGTVEKEDSSLLEGRRVVETAGVDGVSSVVYDVTTADGEEVGREKVAAVVVSAKVDEVVRVGTKAPARQAAPSSSQSSSGSSEASSGASSSASSAPRYSGDVKALGRDLAAARGWGADQFQCLDALWTKESNWNHTAMNPSSGAYGIPQSLPGSKMASVGADWRTNPATQITWGLNYIAGRYGTPCGAWSHSQAVNWY